MISGTYLSEIVVAGEATMRTENPSSTKPLQLQSDASLGTIDLQPGDIVTDDRGGITPYIVLDRSPMNAEDHPDVDLNDPILHQHRVAPNERVFSCVPLPDPREAGQVSPPSEVAAIPESVLTRYPVDAAREDIHVPLPIHNLASFALDLASAEGSDLSIEDVQNAIAALDDYPSDVLNEAIRFQLELED